VRGGRFGVQTTAWRSAAQAAEVAALGLAVPLLRGAAGLVLAAALAALAVGWFVMVVCPAIWSRKPARRKAAQEVLRILRKGHL
jgi:hypothetical protein